MSAGVGLLRETTYVFVVVVSMSYLESEWYSWYHQERDKAIEAVLKQCPHCRQTITGDGECQYCKRLES